MSDIKLTMVKIVADVSLDTIVDYNSLLNHICNSRYRLIDKVPIDIYFIGIVTRFIIKDITHANQLLDVLKEVTQEALEVNGIECTFADKDWNDLFIVEYTNKQYKIDRYYLSTDKENNVRYKAKGYMYELFDNK